MVIKNSQLLAFANSFVNESRKILKKNYFNNFKIEKKLDGSLVTNIDKQIEELFRKKLKSKFPDHGIIGEEFGNYNSANEYVWIIDPLDGTHSFISGKPLFGTLLCCTKRKKPIIGIIDMPILNQRWSGGELLGVKMNNKHCRYLKKKKKLNESIISSTSLLMFKDKHMKKIKEIFKKFQFPIFGTDCYAYGLLLSGKIDVIVEATMKPWDYMAQAALFKELGASISDWEGNDLDINSDGKVVASYCKSNHKKLLSYLKQIE